MIGHPESGETHGIHGAQLLASHSSSRTSGRVSGRVTGTLGELRQLGAAPTVLRC